ncbi:uncharacterized protein AMSG_10771 [Thecamonas trahens ATCC 50062]|uniref:Methyltransferase domain-containing protein n=1 Tax=Thecamonas trahens ATCC 50062 TaxID=461836 RepID=A0A0L0DT06_THETB|nr:hypothetical protein AMSG_10771 [Thecamonas trahens ATCC 50062]KNC55161.1 hypothetical protein AMSG_10771 [Thecamonas trahens ATCC 50062]|eukprot:XP_013753215.1 hypothetical protein AMSG_10771 [Thecamonas trahens ATCC 50062]
MSGASLADKIRQAYYDGSATPKPSEKELDEAMSFFMAASSGLDKGRGKAKRHYYATVIDVCGGHGMLGMLFVLYARASSAIILDRKLPLSFAAMASNWAPATLRFVITDVRDGLESTLADAARSATTATTPSSPRVLVVGCHACGYLTDYVLDMATAAGMDPPGGGHRLGGCPSPPRHTHPSCCHCYGHRLSVALDMARMGRLAALPGYDVLLRTMDPSITPQNRILIAKASPPPAK